jgi:hypothetical protein
VIIACNAAPAGCSVAAMMVASRSPSAVNTSVASFSSRRSPSAGVHDDASHTPRMLPASLPASISACPYLLPSSTESRIPYGFFGRPSGHLLRCSLNGVLPQTQRIPCLTGLNPREPLTSRHRQRGHERPQTSNFP